MRGIGFAMARRLLNSLRRVARFANLRLAILVLALSTTLALLELVTPYLIKILIDNVLITRNLSLFWIVVGLFVLVELALTAVGFAFTYFQRKFEEGVVLNVGREFFIHLEKLDIEFHKQAKVGDLLSRFGNDVRGIQDLMETVSIAFRDSVVGAGTFLVLYVINRQVGLFSLIVFPLYAIVTYRYKRQTRVRSKALRKITGDITGFLQERISFIKVIKIFQSEKQEAESYVVRQQGFIKATLKYTLFTRAVGAVLHYIGYLPTFFVLLFGGYQVLQGSLTIGGLMAIYAYVKWLLGPFSTFGQFGINVQENMGAVDRIYEILDQQPHIVDKEDAKVLQEVQGDLIFDRVSFQYTMGERVLENVTFKIKSGERAALVGPSGAGKTTIADLSCRFYDPTAGAILLDEHDLRDIKLDSLRHHVSVVTQRPMLYNLSIKENIRYGRSTASEAEIQEAAKLAGIHEFITTLNQGYDTIIGERGVRLSEGQGQRISLARMFLKNPSLLILDEATSSLDAESEEKIHRAIGQIRRGKTMLIIAHRLSTIREVDQILVLKDHQITERGTFQELLTARGDFYKLFRQQAEAAEGGWSKDKDYIQIGAS